MTACGCPNPADVVTVIDCPACHHPVGGHDDDGCTVCGCDALTDPPPVVDRAPLRAQIAGGDDLPGVDPGRLERAAEAARRGAARALLDGLADISAQATGALVDIARDDSGPEQLARRLARIRRVLDVVTEVASGSMAPRGAR